MKNYFSTTLVSWFWFGRHQTSNVAVQIKRIPEVAPAAKYTKTFAKQHNITSRQYFSMPRLMAMDLYKTGRGLRLNGGKCKPHESEALRGAAKRIQGLPESGWNVKDFRALIIKPNSYKGLIIVIGSNFEVVPFYVGRRKKLEVYYEYKGSTFASRLEEIQNSQWVYKQVRPELDTVFWSVHSRMVIEGASPKPKIE